MYHHYEIREATSLGYTICDVGGVANLGRQNSKTRRGRCLENGNLCGTLTSEENGVYRMEDQYRIRKLTPRECFKLMGFTDEDFEKAESTNSNTQLYRQAGNSIVKQVLEHVFKQMI